ncbi:MAG: endonuclease/exonuclease/phosphatase family protein [Pseudomonadota bacterium]
MPVSTAWERFLAVCGLGYLLASVGALIDRARFLPTGWIFDLLAHLTPFFVVGGVGLAVLIVLAKRWRLAAGFALLTFVHGLHYADVGDVAHPGDVPEQAPGVRLLSANIFERDTALQNLALQAQDLKADIVGIVEMTDADCSVLNQMFGAEWFCLIVRTDENGRPLTRVNALISRWQPSSVNVHHDPSFGGRAILEVGFVIDGQPFNVIVLHPPAPGAPQYTEQRNAVLRFAAGLSSELPNSVAMGDFNTTPWARIYREFEGQRAGDPRFHSTWLTRWPFLGLPIDHILIAEQLKVSDMRVLEAGGSDHLPIFAEVVLLVQE